MIIELTTGLKLPTSHKDFNKIKSDLTRTIEDYNGAGKTVKFYKEDESGGYIMIPRFYPLPDDEIIDMTEEGEDIDFISNIVPWTDGQNDAVNTMVNNRNGVLKRSTGTGKTMISIHAISIIKKKTLIIMNKDILIKGWIRDITSNTSLTENDVGKLTSKNYKEVLKKPIIISTPNLITHAIKENKEEFKKALQTAGIGFIIIDEVHLGIGPETFSKSSSLTNSARIWGLSATPRRNDGCTDIIHYYLGDLYEFGYEAGEIIDAEIYTIKFDYDIFDKKKKYLMWGGKYQPQRYFQQIKNSEKYMDIVVELAKRAYLDNRVTLLVGSRTDTMLEFAKLCNFPKHDVGICMPTVKKEEKLKYSDITNDTDAYGTKKVIFGTYKSCNEGNSRKDIECLILTSPIGDAEQICGRAVRSNLGKRPPAIFDLVDTGGGPYVKSISNPDGPKVRLYVRQFEKRLEFYNSKKWIVKNVDPSKILKRRGNGN